MIHVVANEEEALTLLEANLNSFFKYIIVDIDALGLKRGQVFLESLKKLDLNNAFSLIVLCSRMNSQEKKVFNEYGVMDILFKPLKMDIVIEKLI